MKKSKAINRVALDWGQRCSTTKKARLCLNKHLVAGKIPGAYSMTKASTQAAFAGVAAKVRVTVTTVERVIIARLTRFVITSRTSVRQMTSRTSYLSSMSTRDSTSVPVPSRPQKMTLENRWSVHARSTLAAIVSFSSSSKKTSTRKPVIMPKSAQRTRNLNLSNRLACSVNSPGMHRRIS